MADRDNGYFDALTQISRHVKKKLSPSLVVAAAGEIRDALATSLETSRDIPAALAALLEDDGDPTEAILSATERIVGAVKNELDPARLGQRSPIELGGLYGMLRGELAEPLRAEVRLGAIRRAVPKLFAWACVLFGVSVVTCLSLAASSLWPVLRVATYPSVGIGLLSLVTGGPSAVWGLLVEFRFKGIVRNWVGQREPADS